MPEEKGVKRDDHIAYFKYTVIEPLIYAPEREVLKTAKDLSEKIFNNEIHRKMVSFSERHLFRMLKSYREQGFNSLKPKPYKNKGMHPSIPLEVIKELLELKKNHPARSAYKVIRIMEISGRVEEGLLHPRTVSRIFSQYGYTGKDLSKDTRAHKKHEKEDVNEMWLSDVMTGFYLGDKLCYLIGFMDDASRTIPHAQFYFDSTLPKLEDAFKKAVTKFGCPTALYVDNGKIYVSLQFKIICAKLGIRLIFATPYHPAGKGKIEKFWDYVQKSFISEIKLNKVRSITELNDLFFAWLNAEYHHKPHAGLKASDDENASFLTPMERWNLSIRNGHKLTFKTPLELDEIFLHEDQRKVNRYGVINFEGNTYEAPGKLVGKTVTVRFDPFDLSVIKIYFEDKYVDLARIIDLKKTIHRDVEKVVKEESEDTEISRLYFENMKINYARYLEEQLKSFETKNYMTTQQNINPDDIQKNRPALKDKKEAMTRDEFINLVARSLGEDILTYTEKTRLYDLFDGLKDFDPGILQALLDEVKSKTPDYHTHFIYYVEQIKNLYLKRRNEK